MHSARIRVVDSSVVSRNTFVGVCMWADGRKYQGLFKEGKRSGYGIFTWPSGCRYEGEWQEDKRHGKLHPPYTVSY